MLFLIINHVYRYGLVENHANRILVDVHSGTSSSLQQQRQLIRKNGIPRPGTKWVAHPVFSTFQQVSEKLHA